MWGLEIRETGRNGLKLQTFSPYWLGGKSVMLEPSVKAGHERCGLVERQLEARIDAGLGRG
jgi:hypothetical protein